MSHCGFPPQISASVLLDVCLSAYHNLSKIHFPFQKYFFFYWNSKMCLASEQQITTSIEPGLQPSLKTLRLRIWIILLWIYVGYLIGRVFRYFNHVKYLWNITHVNNMFDMLDNHNASTLWLITLCEHSGTGWEIIPPHLEATGNPCETLLLHDVSVAPAIFWVGSQT